MPTYWPKARKKLAQGRSMLSKYRFRQAEQLFLEARRAIAEGEGVDSARWGIATLDLAFLASVECNYPLAARRGKNAVRALVSAGPPASVTPAAQAAAITGEALQQQGKLEAAIAYLEFAAERVERTPEYTRISSRIDVQLEDVYFDAGRFEEAADVALRIWGTVHSPESWLRAVGRGPTRLTIRCLEKARRYVECEPIWEWLFANRYDDSLWMSLYEFLGRMAEGGYEQEAKDLFARIEATSPI